MPTVHIVTPNLTPGDAVAQDALGMVEALRGQGHAARLYAVEIDPALRARAEPIACYEQGPADRPDDILIYHHCVAWRRGVEAWTRSRNRRVLKYHNVTPASFYEGIHPDYVVSCTEGAAQTRQLAGLPAELWLADSGYNARDLRAGGGPAVPVRVVPPFTDLDGLEALPADPAILRYIEDGWSNVLFVGRVVPSKGHLDLLEAFAYYHRYLNARSRLFLVGAIDPRLERYTRRLRLEIDRRGLRGTVLLTGKVRPDQLKAYYLIAHAFLCASHHEGFGVPLAEAMAFQVPCIAWGSTAVAGTLGRHALVWQERSPVLLAESLHVCLEDPAVRDHLVRRQAARYRRLFAPAAVRQRFLAALGPLLEAAEVLA